MEGVPLFLRHGGRRLVHDHLRRMVDGDPFVVTVEFAACSGQLISADQDDADTQPCAACIAPSMTSRSAVSAHRIDGNLHAVNGPRIEK